MLFVSTIQGRVGLLTLALLLPAEEVVGGGGMLALEGVVEGMRWEVED